MGRKFDYFAECTGDLTDYLSYTFAKDLDWGCDHLNGLPLYQMMSALKKIILTNVTGCMYIGNNGNIDYFSIGRDNPKDKFVYRIDIDDDDNCYYYITKINNN